MNRTLRFGERRGGASFTLGRTCRGRCCGSLQNKGGDGGTQRSGGGEGKGGGGERGEGSSLSRRLG